MVASRHRNPATRAPGRDVPQGERRGDVRRVLRTNAEPAKEAGEPGGAMNEDTRYRGLRFLGRIHNVIGAVVFGLTILVGASITVAGILGVALTGAGDEFYRDPRALIAGGIIFILGGGFVAAFILGLGQIFRAVADMADNSYTVLFVLAGRPQGPVTAPSDEEVRTADHRDAPAGPIDL